MLNVNEKVKSLLASGLTQKELAELVGVSQPVISDLANNNQKDIGIERGGRRIDALFELRCKSAA